MRVSKGLNNEPEMENYKNKSIPRKQKSDLPSKHPKEKYPKHGVKLH